jgi:hypothetical protein
MEGGDSAAKKGGSEEFKFLMGIAAGASFGLALGVPLGSLCGHAALGVAIGIVVGALALMAARYAFVGRKG